MFQKILVVSAAGLMLMACKKDPDPIPDKTFSFDFESSAEGWQGGFADLPVDADTAFYGLEINHTPLPDPLDVNQKALRISGDNHSDDLFMFFKKQLDGFEPDREYELTFELEFASNAPENSFGVGGSPASVYIKAGAISEEPKEIAAQDDWYRMNIDKGNQSQSGADMQVLGTIGIPGDTAVYKLVQLDNVSDAFVAKTDSDGKLWVIIGSESAFEAVTTLYYNKIDISATAKE